MEQNTPIGNIGFVESIETMYATSLLKTLKLARARNNIGDLLLLPTSFNASYGDGSYEVKAEQRFSQDILAQTLCAKKHTNALGLNRLLESGELSFRPYEQFVKSSIGERAELYRILRWNWEQ